MIGVTANSTCVAQHKNRSDEEVFMLLKILAAVMIVLFVL